MIVWLCWFFLLLFPGAALAQAPSARPRLVLVVVVDQLRPDYLERFRPYFGNGGFNLLLRRGSSFTGAHHAHAITSTCPGHAVVLTGSHGNVNGIIANSWYQGREVYCAADTLVRLVGTSGEGRSPRNLIGLTVGDELTLASAGRSRVVTVAGKDRSAIMLGGHLADAAYWAEDTLFVSSTYYASELPGWVRQFNASRRFASYAGKSWNRLLPRAAYAALGPDEVAAEEHVAGRGPRFPHTLPDSVSSEWFVTSLEFSPFHNELIVDFALRALVEEGLGADAVPDLLGVGLSAVDRVGHAYGPNSHEVMDLIVRTDRLLERLFSAVAKRVGLDNVLIVLTADHGIPPLPELVKSHNSAGGAGRVNPATVARAASAGLNARFGKAAEPGWIVHQSAPMLYLNLPQLRARGIPVAEAEQVAKRALEQMPEMYRVLTAGELQQLRQQDSQSSAALSFFPERSGNVYYELRPYILLSEEPTGAHHGSPWRYDTHVPLLWFGTALQPGAYHVPVSIADVAPTLSALLGIHTPAGSVGRVLHEMLPGRKTAAN